MAIIYNASQKNLISKIKKANPRSDKSFVSIIQQINKLWTIDLADELEVSKPTIERWLLGRNLPHPIMRHRIYNRFMLLIKDDYEWGNYD